MCCVTHAHTVRRRIEKAVWTVQSKTATKKYALKLDDRWGLRLLRASDCVSDKQCSLFVSPTRPIRHRTSGGSVRGTN
jgi:hypothetical protein